MEFLSIPMEVIDDSLLPYLEWNDLLRFRRVCQATKDVTDGYIKDHPELGPEIEINEKDKNIREFLGLNVPKTTKLFVNNTSGEEFYIRAGEEGVEFLERFGTQVKHLRVNQLSKYSIDKELDFIGAFKNLESFEACFVVGNRYGLGNSQIDVALFEAYQQAIQRNPFHEGHPFLNVLKRLRVLKVGNEMKEDLKHVIEFGATLLHCSRKLQAAALPFSRYVPLANEAIATGSDFERVEEFRNNPLALGFLIHLGYIRQRTTEATQGTPDFEMFDFISYHKVEYRPNEFMLQASHVFLSLCVDCFTNDVKLRNVCPYWFQARHGVDFEIPEHLYVQLGIPILSLVNLNPYVFRLNMPNLEKIEIRLTSQSSPGEHWKERRPQWPSLKTLDITVDSLHGKFMEVCVTRRVYLNHKTSTKSVFKFFFEDVMQKELTELRIKFTKGGSSVVIPKVEDIVSSCPNLRKLTLINWPGTNKSLTKLWIGLPDLEEITLERCKGLGNVAFVGEDANSPAFLNLKKLRKMSLKGLDLMPKITDTLFTLLVQHLKLTHLTLTSVDPVKSITVRGVRDLQDGPFADSIEKFSFHDWSLAGVSSKEFKVLEQEFRSYYML